jgi:hypothetical protein
MTVNQERQAAFQRIVIAVLGGLVVGFLLGLML